MTVQISTSIFFTIALFSSLLVHEIVAPLDHIPLHIRGGSIITTQVPAMNTELSRQNPFGLIIAPTVGNTNISFSLYCDDGEEIG